MAKTVNVNQWADVITQAVKKYTEDVSIAIEKETKSTADLVLKEAQRLAPKKTGEYAKGFTKTKRKLAGGVKYIIWNKKEYRRVHLLEFGHAKVNGGRVEGKPHLRPAHEKYVEGFVDRIKKIIKNGG